MSVSLNELEAFHQFAQAELRTGSVESMAELFDQWLLDHPTDEQRSVTHEAIRQGLAEIATGQGRPATQATAELLRKHGIPAE